MKNEYDTCTIAILAALATMLIVLMTGILIDIVGRDYVILIMPIITIVVVVFCREYKKGQNILH